MWLLILKLELLVGARYPHRIYISAYRSHELLSECLCLIFSLILGKMKYRNTNIIAE